MPYQKIDWKNGPAGKTPVNASNLNRMDGQIFDNEAAIEKNTADIVELQNKPVGLALTGKRRLTTSDAGKILSLDVMGKSSQIDTRKFSFSQGAIVPTVGSRLDQDINANESRCTSDILELTTGTVISAPAGYEIYIAHAATASGSIDISQTWVTTYTTSTGGFWRIVCRNKSNTSATIRPSECNINIAGQPTPDHEIPIVNASGVIKAIGKNLFDPENVFNGHTNDATINANDAARLVYAKCEPGQTYTVSKKSGQRLQVAYTSEIPALGVSYYGKINSPTASAITITTGDNAKYVVAFVWLATADTTITAEDMLASVQIEEGTATAYEPYQSNEIDLSAYDLRSAGTAADQLIVYPDKTGKLIKWTDEVDLGTLDYTYTASWGGHHAFTTEMQGIIMPVNSNNEYGNIMSEKFIVSTRNIMASASAEGLMCLNTYGSVIFATDTVSSVEAFKTAMSGTKLFYARVTPTETALTAEQVAEILALETYAPETIIETELDVQSVGYTGDVKGYIDSRNVYSTEETICGYEEDGTPRYRRKINTTTPSTAGSDMNIVQLPANIKVKKIEGMVYSSGNTDIPINFFYSTSYYSAFWIKDDYIRCRVGSLYANMPCEISLEYIYKDAAPAAASVMALTDDDTQKSDLLDDGLKKGTIIDDSIVYGGI